MKANREVIDVEIVEAGTGSELATVGREETALSADLVERLERTKKKAGRARSDSTRKAYASDWSHFVAFCDTVNLNPLPALPGTVALYLDELDEQGFKVATMQRRMSAISVQHKAAGYLPPTAHPDVCDTWEGIRRDRAEQGRVSESKTAAVGPVLRQFLESIDTDTLQGKRDRAVLLVGFFGAFRRSELVALNVEDVEFTDAGATVKVRRSKTDQKGEGAYKAIPRRSGETCPVAALVEWIASDGIESGAIFRSIRKGGSVVNDRRLSGRDVARTVKRAADRAGLDSAAFSGHSLRSGFATTAAHAGASDRSIMVQTGHKSRAMVDRYVQAARVWEDNAAGLVSV